MGFFHRRRYTLCSLCEGRGGWTVPAHCNYWAWGVVPSYWNRCRECEGRGKLRVEGNG